MKFKIVNRLDKKESKWRLFRIIFNKGHHVVKISLWFKLWHCAIYDGGRKGKPWLYDVAVTILGVRLHWQRGFGIRY